MGKKLIFLLSLLIFMGCSRNEEIPDQKNSKFTVEGIDRSVFAYLIANNNLGSFLRTNVVDMCKGMAKQDYPSELLVYWDGQVGSSSWPETCILRYTTDGKGRVNGLSSFTTQSILDAAEVLKEYPSQLATDKQVMATVIRDMMSLSSPTSIYHGIIVSSHGSGWLKHITGTNTRALGPDGADENSITIPDMAEALEAAGKRFDFLLFDACMMACSEVLYELRDVVDYNISSVIDVLIAGFPYEAMFHKLSLFSVDGYKEACDIYIDYYTKSDDFGTVSLVDCKQMEALAQAVKKEVATHSSSIGTYDNAKLQFYGDESTGNRTMKLLSADMVQFIRLINNGVLPTDFKTQFDKTLLYAAYVKDSYNYKIDGDNYCGIGMYLPMQNRRYWNEYFQTIGWYTAAGWDAVTWPLPQ